MRYLFPFLSLLTIFSCKNNSSQTENTISLTPNPIQEISFLIKKDITNDSLYVERAKLNIKKERYEEAFRDLNTSLDLDSTFGHAHFVLGELLMDLTKKSKGDINSILQSLEHFQSAIKYGSDSALAYRNGGEILLYVLKFEKSIELFNLSIELDKSDYKSYILQGYSYVELNEIEKAKESFQNSINVKADNEEAYLQIGNIYARNWDTLAVEYFKNALNINPENRMAQYNIGLIYQNNMMYNKALDAYYELFNKDIEDLHYVEANYNLGFIFMEYLKDYKLAINYFADATRVNPKHEQSYFAMGRCYQSFGDIVNAERYFRKSLEVNPNYKNAKDQLEKLLSDNEKYK